MVACTAKTSNAVRALLANGANISLANQHGVNALMCAARIDPKNENHKVDSCSVLQILLAEPDAQNILNSVNNVGNSALHFAVISKNAGAISLLLSGELILYRYTYKIS